MQAEVPSVIGPAGFEDQHSSGRIFTQSAGQNATGRAAANDDLVVGFFHQGEDPMKWVTGLSIAHSGCSLAVRTNRAPAPTTSRNPSIAAPAKLKTINNQERDFRGAGGEEGGKTGGIPKSIQKFNAWTLTAATIPDFHADENAGRNSHAPTAFNSAHKDHGYELHHRNGSGHREGG